MTTLLRWIEPAKPGRRRRWADVAIAFGVSLVIGLALAEQSGPTARLAVGSGTELTIPAQPWQYGIWLVATVAGGWLGVWIMSFGGRAEVTLRDDGIQWLLGRATYRQFPYARIARCELHEPEGGPAILRIAMAPAEPGADAEIVDFPLPARIRPAQVRDVLRGAGVQVVAPS